MFKENIWANFTEKLTPSLNLLNNLKNKESEKSAISDKTCEDIKKWLESDLSKWINIHSKEDFDALMWLLVKHWILKNSPEFSSLKNSSWNNITDFIRFISFLKNTKVNWKEVILSVRKI